jgi:hypothetical protein
MRVRITPFVLIPLSSLLLAACAGSPVRHALETNNRTPPGGRDVLVLVSQGEIRANVIGATIPIGGLLPALVAAGVTQHRASKAEETITAIRDGLNGYNFDEKALAKTKETTDKLDWLGAKSISFTKDVSKESQLRFLDKSQSPQVVFASYDYALAADFSAVVVTTTFSVLQKEPRPGEVPGDRIKPSSALYSQVFICVVPMSNVSSDMKVNAHRWADNGSALTRRALDEGLARIQGLIERSLALTPTDVANLARGETMQIGTYKGRLYDRDPYGALLIDGAGGWIYLENAPIG